MSLTAAAGLATASAATTSGTDTCGYPNSSGGQSATVFNESTLTRWVQIFGSGSSARIGVFSNDENGVLLGIGATPSTGVAHVSGPSLGNMSATDPSGRPYHPSLYITNVTSNASSTAGDWQHGGTATSFVSDAYGTWISGSFSNGQYQRSTLPSKNDWNLGAGADVPSPGFSALGNEGYGSEFTWNVAALGLQPGNTYRFQVMTHDGDQNRSGGDVGELCTNLTIPGPPATPAVTVAKTNNASGNGFAKSSTAPQAGANVPFQLVVTNTSNESETVTSLSDAWPNSTIQPDCRTTGGNALLGATLSAGASVTCTFTVNGYAPPAGQSLTDTVSVTVTDSTNQTASDTSQSVVTTPALVNQKIAGSILLCDANGNRTSVPVNGGTLHVLSGNTVMLSANDQLPATSIGADTYTMAGTAPSGYQFVPCGVGGVTISAPPTTASQTVVVPAGQNGSGTFYVTPVVIGNQSISGSVLLCDAAGNRTSVPVNGGSLQVLSGASVILTANDQLPPASVAAGTYTMAGTAPSGYQFVPCGVGGVTISAPPTTASQTVNVPAGSTGTGVFYVSRIVVGAQTISGSILLCDPNGAPTTSPVNGGSLQVLSGSTVILNANDQLPPATVAAGTYSMAGTAPSGYQFVSCGATGVAIATPPTTASQTVVVPAGLSGSGVFYVRPVPVTQTIAGSILLCDASGAPTSTPVYGGSLTVLSGTTVMLTANNQLPATPIAAGAYTMGGSAPFGYQFVSCGATGVAIATPPTTASQTVNVPVGSSGSGVFYVKPTAVNQTIAGSILLCDPSGAPTTTAVYGGSLTVLSGSTVMLTANSQLPATSIAAGTYTLGGSAPSGYQFVPCGATGVTIPATPTTASQTVVVPSGSSGSGVFYVKPITVNQTVGGSILLCDVNGNPTTTPVNGGSLQLLSGNTVFASATDQLSPVIVPAGTYTLTAVAPLGYKFDTCGATSVIISSPPTGANQTVNVPAGQNVTGVFYVDRVPLVATIDKTNNAAGTGYGKVELASSPGQDVPFRAVITNNSVVPVVITSLTDAWPGQVPFSPACAQAVIGAVLAANGGSVTCDFTLANYSPPAGQWLVDTVTAGLSQLDVASNSTVSSNSTTIANTSTVGTVTVLGLQISPPTTAGQVTVLPMTISPSSQATAPLAFTGAPSRLWEVLEVGLVLMSAGCFVLWLTRPREPLPMTGRL